MSIEDIVFGFGFVAVIEGLVLALAPSHMERLLQIVANTPLDIRRIIGLSLLAIGVIMVRLVHG